MDGSGELCAAVADGARLAAARAAFHADCGLGGGGTGKTVVSAELLDRFKGRVVAFHFCRHDNPAASEPGPLVRSLAAMLCKNVPGYMAAVQQQDHDALAIAMASNLISELFPVLLLQPLQALGEPAGGTKSSITH